jgi:ubiquinone/menaquinone biosynthesis C-methylase UbiE
MSAYDVVAPSFDSYRALPPGVPEAIRAAVLKSARAAPRVLDLGAGSGRIGAPFVAAGDDYVGVDLSSGMLREFTGRAAAHGDVSPQLVQANGELLPFRDAAFDAVMLIQVFGGLRGWRRFIAEARRVLRPPGAIIVGRTEMPPDGIDARMKQRLAAILAGLGAEKDRANAREDIAQWLESNAGSSESVTAASWTASRTPRGFIERHGSGARFAALPAPLKTQALRELGAWAAAIFGSLDAAASEPHAFALQIFKFHNGNH